MIIFCRWKVEGEYFAQGDTENKQRRQNLNLGLPDSSPLKTGMGEDGGEEGTYFLVVLFFMHNCKFGHRYRLICPLWAYIIKGEKIILRRAFVKFPLMYK